MVSYQRQGVHSQQSLHSPASHMRKFARNAHLVELNGQDFKNLKCVCFSIPRTTSNCLGMILLYWAESPSKSSVHHLKRHGANVVIKGCSLCSKLFWLFKNISHLKCLSDFTIPCVLASLSHCLPLPWSMVISDIPLYVIWYSGLLGL